MKGTSRQTARAAKSRMRYIPDLIIVVGVIIGAAGIATGYRSLGSIFLAFALLVGWKRDWCMDSFEGMVSSSEHSAVNELHGSDAAGIGDAGDAHDADGGH